MPLLTAGDDLVALGAYLADGGHDYGADVLRLLQEPRPRAERDHDPARGVAVGDALASLPS